ncbi:hypothetical protein [Streptomyces sp. NBC_00197]|uniref:hypothetical protein n=1 Tax=Streptomyces sp. NBC_00197 TaxID=2975676 RepID=UPI00324AFB2A
MINTYGSKWASYLHRLAGEWWQAEEIGDVKSFGGWYAFFPQERSILSVDSQGHVTAREFTTREECWAAWSTVRDEHAEFRAEELEYA